jgi:hypothetical protein
MFGLFKKKSPEDKLREKYQQLMSEAHKLSQTDRKAGDDKMAEAEKVMQELEAMKNK